MHASESPNDPVEITGFTPVPGDNIFSQFLNGIANYALFIGLQISFLPIGYLFTLQETFKNNRKYIFLTIQIILTSLIWIELIYARIYLVLLITVISSLGIFHFYKLYLKKYRFGQPVMVSLIIFLVAVPNFIEVSDKTQILIEKSDGDLSYNEMQEIARISDSVDERSYNTAMYIKYNGNYELLSNQNSVENKVRAYAGQGNPNYRLSDFMTVGGFNITIANVLSLLNGEKVGIVESDEEHYSDLYFALYTRTDLKFTEAFRGPIYYNVGTQDGYFVLLISGYSSVYIHEDGIKESAFMEKVNFDNYKVYADGLQELRYLSF